MKYILLFTLFIASDFSFAKQQSMVHVEDGNNKEPLTGASIYWEGSHIGAVTDASGMTMINEPPHYPANLIVSYVGYQSDTTQFKNFTPHIHISLVEAILLDATDVTGRKKDSYIKTFEPSKIEMISQNELRKAACCNLSESFQTNASAQVNFEDAVTGAKQIELLGLKGIYVQNTIENTPALRGLSSSFALDNVPAPWIKSIELSKGTPSVRSGYEGITGSININYKEPEDLGPLYLDVFANHTGRLEGNWISSIHKEKWGTAFFANGAMTKDKRDRNGDSFYDQTQVNQVNLMNRWDIHGENFESKLLLKGLHENRISGQIPNENLSNPYQIGIKTSRIEGFGKTGIFLPGNLNRSIGITTSGFWHDQKGNYGFNNYDGTQGSFFGNVMFESAIVNTGHTLFTGASIMYDKFQENVNGTQIDRTDIVPGLAAEYTYKYLDKITLVAGVRTDFPNRFKVQINPRLHFRYEPKIGTQIRVSAGRGFRIPNVYAENIYMFASSRSIDVQETPRYESAWNFGANLIQEFKLGNINSNIAIDYYRTNFTHQVIVDVENADNHVAIYNLDGKSYSNSFLVEWTLNPVAGLDVKLAYRLEDVHQTMHGELMRKSMTSPHRGLVYVSYKTRDEKWMLSSNMNIQSKTRFPLSFIGDKQAYSPVNAQLGAQVTRYQGDFEFFVGGENLLNIRQKYPIIGYDNPFGSNFDTYQVWGTVIGPMAYAGIRFNLNNKK
ncbi:MAG: TonB-dependent receptor [Chitinophagales bacterium]|nr:TonB-dependent receptor [Chitinophagales bacterium]